MIIQDAEISLKENCGTFWINNKSTENAVG